MILRVIGLVTSIALFSCLAEGHTGHTIGNGGGDPELELVEIWGSLSRKLAPCAHPAALCALNEAQRERVAELIRMRNRLQHIPAFDPARLYTASGEAKTHEEILAIALDLLQSQSCEDILATPLDTAKLAAHLNLLQYFKVFEMPAGEFIVKAFANSVTVTKGENSVNLSPLIEARLGAPVENIGHIAADFKRGRFEIRGRFNGSEVLALVEPSLNPGGVTLFIQ